ncbi:putative repeat protein (TIGR03987 family) [Clostridium moniliforme]|uniref:Repeat protein (TIGR03987 family) n=1 Tax=Clostridium moniliforme TaxID=39489 RepID=A0ABS4F0W8_9CLOT|nr:HsmA family protein [Clostridium moniliforme]MBP1889898.1 putative repeat protein (TIGR03987 family) [Clostridium moniliforme]
MPKLLIPAIIFITLALIFYTIGVWGEHKAKILKKKHVIIFWCGLVCDTLGTFTMSRIVAAGTDKTITNTQLMIHQSTGLLAIILMLFHAVWATWVLNKGSAKAKEAFHKFSMLVWFIWLIPYFVGMYIGMAG